MRLYISMTHHNDRYVDSLALTAKLGFEATCRQDYIGIDYGLVDCSTGAPLPDFWTAMLWNRLVGHNVLSASISSSNQGQVRTYAHCTAPQAGATPGSITLIILNLDSIATSVSTSFGVGMISSSSNNEKQKRKGTATIFQLTPSNSAGLGSGVGVNGTVVQLNGKTLQLENSSGDVPELLSMGITHDAKNDVALPPQSITFVVYTSYDGAKASVCI